MPARVLVVEDDPEIVALYRDILTEEGWDVDVGELGLLANSDTPVGTPDVILLDWMLGHQAEGANVLRRLRADPATSAIPVVVCTVAAKTIAAVEAELITLGIPIVPKPFQVDEMLDVLGSALRSASPGSNISMGA